MVQDLTFSSIITSDTSQTNRPTVMSARGTNISIRNCTIHNMGYMVTTVGKPKGTLVQDNSSPDITGLSGYMVWMESSDIVILGNKAANSTREHIVRSSSNETTRVLVAYNDFTNLDRTDVDGGDQSKTTVNIRSGNHIYIAENKLTSGVVGFGPTRAMGLEQIADTIVVEGNEIHGTMMQISTGTYNFAARNNLLDNVGQEQIALQPTVWDMPSRTASNWIIANNTGVNTTDTGKFIKVYSNGAPGTISVLNNLFIAPNLKNGTAMDVHAGNLSMFKTISHNVWPATTAGAKLNVVNDVTYTQAQWEDTDQVQNDVYLQIGTADGYSVTLPDFSAGRVAA
jgi:hypothetical protein